MSAGATSNGCQGCSAGPSGPQLRRPSGSSAGSLKLASAKSAGPVQALLFRRRVKFLFPIPPSCQTRLPHCLQIVCIKKTWHHHGWRPAMATHIGNANNTQAAVVIIGAGISGLSASIDLLKRNNCSNFIILEENGGAGGTWRDNTYPGCCCDGGLCRFSRTAMGAGHTPGQPSDSQVSSLQLFVRTQCRLDARICRSRGDSSQRPPRGRNCRWHTNLGLAIHYWRGAKV
jgi:hypothetical protein